MIMNEDSRITSIKINKMQNSFLRIIYALNTRLPNVLEIIEIPRIHNEYL